ncbi:TaqI-like C-terminal specificity domain-containing protein [Tateyamaria sp.]|uniref:TaqI-like C-terminal specificity domain-containing protein n=1 Tax=Tateyamaria sp. TaxID=1929288 RepID=UPI003B20E47C
MPSQLSFDIPASNKLSVDEVAEALQVSTASVRNWIKTGYLETTNGSQISRASFDTFKASVVGEEKLTSRANKSNFDGHDHEDIQATFLKRIFNLKSHEFDSIGSAYETSLSNSYRNKEGVYYTPAELTKRFFDFIEGDVSTLTFCDPCCGSGNFIVEALNRGFLPENIYGFDCDPVAVEITKARIKQKTNFDSNTILVADFLDDIVLKINTKRPAFDIIMTNPPWGKKLPASKKIQITSAFGCAKSTDTSALFLRAALQQVSSNGIIGMLLPESFFNIASFSPTRQIVAGHNLLGFVDFGKPFNGLITKAKGIIFQKLKAPQNDNNVLCETSTSTHSRSQNSFIENPKHIFNFECTEETHAVIRRVYDTPHVTLESNAKWGLGIVTGNNKKHVRSCQSGEDVPVYKGSEIVDGPLSNASNFISNDLSQYQQVAPHHLYYSPEKLIYRFISSRLVFHHDTQSKLFLNSANMLVLNNDFPLSHKETAWLLNTKIVNWIFRTVFDTHKVLRSDLEALPMFHDFFNQAGDITEENLHAYLNVAEEKDGTFRIKK